MTKMPDNSLKTLKLMFSKPKDFIIFMTTTILVSLSEIFMLLLFKNFIDTIEKDEKAISLTVITLVLLLFIFIILLIIRNISKTNIALNVRSHLIKKAHSSMLNATIHDLSKEEVKNALGNVIKNTNYIAYHYIKNNILSLFQFVTMFLIFVITGLIVQPILSLIVLLFMPFYYVSLKACEFALNKMNKHTKELEDENNERIKYTLDVITDIKLKSGVELEKEELNAIVDETNRVYINNSFLKLVTNSLINIIFLGTLFAIIIGLGGTLLQGGDTITIGDFTFFPLLTILLFSVINSCMHMKVAPSHISKENSELNIIYSLYSEIKSEPISNFEEIHSFKFKDITLNNKGVYPLENISFEIKRNEKLGILTNSTETKDAIFNIITKICKDHTGEVLINNCELSKIQTLYLRSIISSVSKNNGVLNRTILENVIYPEKFDDYRYNDALNRTGLKEIISSFPDKGNTMLDKNLENFDDIATRVVFANALYHDAKIYLFNDFISDIKPQLEVQMNEEIRKLKNKIIINITDNPYQISNYDKILIIENGKQVEFGKYDDLINDKNSLYYKMIKNAPIIRAKIS